MWLGSAIVVSVGPGEVQEWIENRLAGGLLCEEFPGSYSSPFVPCFSVPR
jgi:hypothetical protein